MFKLEGSASFSYTCHNFEVPEYVGIEESAPFLYTCRNFDGQYRSGNAFACVYPARYDLYP